MAERKMPVWAVLTQNLSNGDPNKLDPGGTKQQDGFIIERPLVQTMNWLLNLLGHFVKANNEVKIEASTYEAEAGETVLLDNSAAPAVGMLPSSPIDRQRVTFGGVALNSVYALTVNGNGSDIMEVGIDIINLDVDDQMVSFVWDATSSLWETYLADERGRV